MAKEKFFRTATGVDLYWTVYAPDNTPRPWVLGEHPGGWKGGNASLSPAIVAALNAAGFTVAPTEYRLAPPGGVTGPMSTVGGHLPPAQDTWSDPGHWPKPHQDMAAAIVAAKADPRCNGDVWILGGSAGASLALFFWAHGLASDDGLLHNGFASGVVGDTTIKGAICFSIGVANNADPNIWAFPDPGDETYPAGALANHLNIPNTAPNPPTGADLVIAQNSSATNYIPAAGPSRPALFILCANGNGISGGDSLGIACSTGVNIATAKQDGTLNPVENGANGAIPKLLTAGYTESTSAVPVAGTFKKQLVTVSAHAHAFQYALDPTSNPPNVLASEVIPFMLGTVGTAPPPPGIPKGVVVATTAGDPIDQPILDNEDVAGVGLTVHWSDLEPTEGNLAPGVLAYLVGEIKRAAAAGKTINLRITGMGGSAFFGGDTPNWFFDAAGQATAGRGSRTGDAQLTNGSATVTSNKAQWTAADLHGRITCAVSGFPVTAYTGIVNAPNSIGLSSSQTANTPVNFTGTNTSNAAIVMPDRGGKPSYIVGDATTPILIPSGSFTLTNPLNDFTPFINGKVVQAVNLAANVTLTYVSASTATLSFAPTADVKAVYLPARNGTAYDSHSAVPGVLFSFTSKKDGATQQTIPVFFNPLYLAKKRAMKSALGLWLETTTDLTSTEKGAVRVTSTSFANATTEDWAMPDDKDVDTAHGYVLSPLDAWRKLPTDLPFPGAGYTTQKMIDAEVKNGNETFADGATNGTGLILTSKLAGFSVADIGKVVEGVGITTSPPNKIASYGDTAHVTLSTAATINLSGVTFTIKDRDSGLVDAEMAAFKSQFITLAVGSNGGQLDKDAAVAAGDSDSQNYLPRAVSALIEAKYPGRFITQSNSLSTKSAPYPGTGSRMAVLGERATAGYLTGGQMLWFTFGDLEYRNNGGVAGEATAILEAAASIGHGYKISYLEIYGPDALNLPLAVTFIHDLLVGFGAPQPQDGIQPPRIVYEPIGYLKVLYAIAAKLGIDVDRGLSNNRGVRWDSQLNENLNYAWNFINWPQFMLVEERACRMIWNGRDIFNAGTQVYFLGTDDIGTARGYYTATADAPPGADPTDSAYWTPFTLGANDYYIELAQRCRRRLGEIDEVYPWDPRNTDPPPCALSWRLSWRGLEVYGAPQTVFVRYRVNCPSFSSVAWSSGASYEAGDVRLLADDGECYRAIVPVNLEKPGESAAWAKVPFPRALKDYVVGMVAADEASDMQSAAKFAGLAKQFIQREADKAGAGGGRWGSPARYGYYWPWPLSDAAAATRAPNTISSLCVDEWGELIPS